MPHTLSAPTRLKVIELQDQLGELHTPCGLLDWAKGPLQEVLPHESLACGVFSTRCDGVVLRRVLQQDWPAGYFDALTEPDGRFRSPVIRRWSQSQAPQVVRADDTERFDDPLWSEVFRDMGMRNMAAHGVMDLNSRAASYVCFSRMPDDRLDEVDTLLKLLAPHMALALQRALLQPGGDTPHAPPWLPKLSPRERVVLHWMCRGKTNWEIAQICQRSEHTIKNQVESVRQKLQVNNRTQACALAADVDLLIDEAA
ncbi:MAG: hypothetical protein I8H76_05705 [Burkholderiales bacterium]|nr:hypothetical protein [Burkholderiales bacterium]MBH2015354.1 hypothetical protein [Burkholderiales bacterium]